MVDLVLQVLRFVEPIFLGLLQIILDHSLHHSFLVAHIVQFALPELQAMTPGIIISESVVMMLLLNELFCVDHLPPQLGVIIPPHFARIFIGRHSTVLIYFIVRL